MTSSPLFDLDPSLRMLSAGDLQATFLPNFGMLCASLKHRGIELLGRVEDVPTMAKTGRTCGIPLLYPWANRLAGMSYTTLGQSVELDPTSRLLYFDAHGLPMHGVPWSRLKWHVTSEATNSLVSQLDWDSDALLAVFPYPHQLTFTAQLEATQLTLEIIVRANKSTQVPLSFGVHPYLQLPVQARSEWIVDFPAMQHLELDANQIPTGRKERFHGLEGPLNNHTFDDGFALLEDAEQFIVEGGGRRVTMKFLKGFPYAQIFVPPGQSYIALEPMTAPANALVSGRGLGFVQPGESSRASFALEIETF
jgi:aldose 1-epimerase